jgi:hypothetical protein
MVLPGTRSPLRSDDLGAASPLASAVARSVARTNRDAWTCRTGKRSAETCPAPAQVRQGTVRSGMPIETAPGQFGRRGFHMHYRPPDDRHELGEARRGDRHRALITATSPKRSCGPATAVRWSAGGRRHSERLTSTARIPAGSNAPSPTYLWRGNLRTHIVTAVTSSLIAWITASDFWASSREYFPGLLANQSPPYLRHRLPARRLRNRQLGRALSGFGPECGHSPAERFALGLSSAGSDVVRLMIPSM